MENQTQYRAGFVAVIGRPNVGKSSLLNLFLGQKVAAVSPRPQTTRRRQLGILSRPDCQMVFIDTPGIHKPHHKLGEFMNQEATEALEDVDLILWMVDASEPPTEEDGRVAARLKALNPCPPVILALNKADLPGARAEREARAQAFLELLPAAQPRWISVARQQGSADLLEEMAGRMPPGQPFYDPEQVTDLYEREITADLIRQAALENLREEIPHSIAVSVDEFLEEDDTRARIHATIHVERESHKGIVIGKGGEMIKRIGTSARREIEAMSGRSIYLELRVKVSENWRDDPRSLRLFGYLRQE